VKDFEFFSLMCEVSDAVILVPLFHTTLADWIGIALIPCGPSREDFIAAASMIHDGFITKP
jgi:hypothetical protein